MVTKNDKILHVLDSTATARSKKQSTAMQISAKNELKQKYRRLPKIFVTNVKK